MCVRVFYFVQFCDVAEVAIIHNGFKFQPYASERFKHPLIVFGYLLELNLESGPFFFFFEN